MLARVATGMASESDEVDVCASINVTDFADRSQARPADHHV